MARRKCLVLKNFKIIEDGAVMEYKKGQPLRLGPKRYNNWLKNKLIK